MLPKSAEHRKRAISACNVADLSEEDREGFPNLVYWLLGTPGKASGTWDVPKYKLLVWEEQGRVKAMLGAGDENDKWWCTFKEFGGLLDMIEKQLDEGGGEWRPAKEPHSSGQNGKK